MTWSESTDRCPINQKFRSRADPTPLFFPLWSRYPEHPGLPHLDTGVRRMKRMTVANPGLWGMGTGLPDARACSEDGSDGVRITDVVIKRIHDAVRILSLKKKPKPSSARPATR
jgi:hypothetical protein